MPSYGIGGYASTLVNPAGGGAGYGGGGYGGGEFVSPRERLGAKQPGDIWDPNISRWVIPGGGGGMGGGMGDLPQMPYQPGAPAAAGVAGTLETTGRGLLDPGSAYSKRMREELTGTIGAQSAAQKRAAALQASQAGYGGGESPELMSALTDIDVGGMEAMGESLQDLLMKSPELALQFLTPAMQARLGISAQDLEAWLGQQQIQQRGQELGQAGALGWAGLGLEQQKINQNAMMNQLGLMFGGI